MNLGKTYYINKENKVKRINEIELNNYLSLCWNLGKNVCWINKDNKNKQINNSELIEYLNNN